MSFWRWLIQITAPLVSVKAAILSSSAMTYSRRVLANKDLDMDVKMAVVSSLMFSRSMFQAGTWPELLATEYGRFKAPVMKIYRTAARSFCVGSDGEQHNKKRQVCS